MLGIPRLCVGSRCGHRGDRNVGIMVKYTAKVAATLERRF